MPDLAKPTLTPAEHYAEAERLLDSAVQLTEAMNEILDGKPLTDPEKRAVAAATEGAVTQVVAMAQVHATLASCRQPDARNQPGHHYYDPTSYDPGTLR